MSPANTQESALPPLLCAQPALLAPMEGVSHPAFRAAIGALGGVGMLCTEFVRISRSPLQPKHLREAVVKFEGVPLSVQVMGNDADKMADAARCVEDAGADVIDINLGCPTPRAVRGGVGAAMLKDLSLLAEVLGAMRAAVRGRLSAKIRAGFDDADKTLAIAKTLQDAGVDFIAVHPRRRCDFYQGVADWRIIATLKGALTIPVIGNGDVWYARDALRMQEETGCDAVMIGRPAVRNPWIFQQIQALREGTPPPIIDGPALLHYCEGPLRAITDPSETGVPIGKLKESLGYLLRAVPDQGALRLQVLRSQSVEAIYARLREALPAFERLDLDADPAQPIERSGSASSFKNKCEPDTHLLQL